MINWTFSTLKSFILTSTLNALSKQEQVSNISSLYIYGTNNGKQKMYINQFIKINYLPLLLLFSSIS